MVSDRVEVFIHGQSKEAKTRLDLFLTGQLPEYSRSRLQGLIKNGLVKINDAPANKAGQLLEPGDRIEICIPPPVPSGLIPENIPLDIVYENSDLVIVNKPAGMVVHPAPGHGEGTLVHAALGHIPDLAGIGGEERPGIVHRLDKDTSGLIIIAKNERSHIWLQDQFRQRQVEKTYLALVDGKPPTPNGRIEASIGRNTTHRKLMTVVPNEKGREATTDYQTIKSYMKHTLLEIHPLTGRTHQIRVHLSSLGCPIAGDRVYGKKVPTIEINRHFLHAWKIKIILPGDEKPKVFEAPLPEELSTILESL